ncbi:MAG: hypothetical protein ACFFEY_08470, partial [Candidatus Thorarchaeota archaeon]
LYDDAFKLAESTYELSLELGNDIILVDSLIIMAESALPNLDLEKILEIIKKAEEHLNKITKLKKTDYKHYKAQILFLKARYHAMTYVPERVKIAFDLVEQALVIQRKLGIKREIIHSLIIIALWHGFDFEIDSGIKSANEALNLANVTKNRYLIALSMKTLMLLYSFKGELNRSLKYAKKSLAIFKEINNTLEQSRVLTQIGDKYMRKGEFEESLKYLKQSLVLYKNLNYPDYKAVLICTLIEVNLALDDNESAKFYLKQLKELSEEQPSKWINLILRVSKAINLKQSLRVRDRVKAEQLFKEIIEEYGDDITVIECFIHLSDLLLIELRFTNDFKVLQEIEYYVQRLINISEKSNSFWILGETYLLQAKLALIKLDLTEARHLLTEGQNIAEKHNLTYLAMRISNEHDELLKELGNWENFKQTKASLEERMKLSRLSEQMDIMAKKRIIEPRELVNELPVAILIIAEGGFPLFSQSFEDEWSFANHLFGGFLTAINSFSDEIFSEGFDRASFGKYTILMKSISSFSVCYLFKGKTYPAQQKMKNFIESIINEKKILDTFHDFCKTNREIRLDDIPSLKHLIENIFINKPVSLA